jgi:hypothetical protein
MKLRATPMPIDTPTPAVPPTATAAENARTVEAIPAWLAALTVTSPSLSMALAWL